jgi:hypothetical protein
MEQSYPEPLVISGNKDVPFNTRIPELTNRLYFHSIIKESARSKHYIVEDISNLNDQSQPVFYYLKQTVFNNPKQHNHAMRYYIQFLEYCKSPTAKSEIAKLLKIHHYEEHSINYFELTLIFEYGDSDRINIAIIEPEQILRFIKNICLLLQDVYNFNQVTHGNLHLKNIVLCNNELKISGFKPIWTEGKDPCWKAEVVKKWGGLRLDFFCTGLVWLNFLDFNMSAVLKQDRPIADIQNDLLAAVPTLANVRKGELLIELLKLSEVPVMKMESVLLEFDEYFVMERISMSKQSKNEDLEATRNSFQVTRPDLQNDMSSRQSVPNSVDDNDQKLSVNEENMFKKALGASDKDVSFDADKRSADFNNAASTGPGNFKSSADFVLNEHFSVIPRDDQERGLKQSKMSLDQSQSRDPSRISLPGSEPNPGLKTRMSENQFSSVESTNSAIRKKPSELKTVVHAESPINIGSGKEEEKGQANDELGDLDIRNSFGGVSTDARASDRRLGSLAYSKNGSSQDPTSFNDNVTLTIQESESAKTKPEEGNRSSVASKGSKRLFENPADLRISDKLEATLDRKSVTAKPPSATTTDKTKPATDTKNVKLKPLEDPQKIGSSKGGKSGSITMAAESISDAKLDFKKKNSANKVNTPEAAPAQSRLSRQESEMSKNSEKKISAAEKPAEKKTSLLEKIQQKPILKPGETKSEALGVKRAAEIEKAGFDEIRKAEEEMVREIEKVPQPAPRIESVSAEKKRETRGASVDGQGRTSKTPPKQVVESQWVKDSISPAEGFHRINDSIEVMADVLSLDESKHPQNPNRKGSKNVQSLYPLNPVNNGEYGVRGQLLQKKSDALLQQPDKTLSNLPPEVVERALQKKKLENALKLKSEKERLRQMEEEHAKHERREQEYDQRINEILIKNLEQKLFREQEKTVTQKRVLIEKQNEKTEKEKELFERLKRKAEEKYVERKHEEFDNYKQKRQFLDTVAHKHEPFENFKVRKPKPEKPDKMSETAPVKQKRDISVRSLNPPPKIKRDRSENTLAPAKKIEFGLSRIDVQDKKFQFNHHHQVFQIPFRKVVEKFDEAVALDGKELKVRNFHKTVSASQMPKRDQAKILEKFEDTLKKYKDQSFEGVSGAIGDFANGKGGNKTNGMVAGPQSEAGSRKNFGSTHKFGILIDEAAFASKLKSVESDASQQVWSLSKRTYHPEGAPNELDLSHIRHVDFRSQALPNPIKEYKDLSYFRNDQVYLPEINDEPNKLRDFAIYCQTMLNDEKLDEMLDKIHQKTEKLKGAELVELNKIIASILFASGDLEKAKEELLNAVENIKEINDETAAQKQLGEVILNISLLEFLNGDIADSIEMLKNPVVERRFPGKITNIKGNSYMTINKPKLAREMFLAEIRALLSLEPKLPVIMKVYQLIGKVLETFKMEKDKMGPAGFYQVLETQLVKISNLYKNLDKQATKPYEGIMDLIVMKFLAFGFENKNFGLMNFVLEKSLKNKTLSPPAQLNPTYREELCRYTLGICDYLKNKPNFGGFEKNYNTYLQLADELVGTSEVNVESLKLNLILLFNKGVFLMQKKETSEARATFQECFDILRKIFELDTNGVFQLIDNMAKTLLKNRDFDNAAFFYEEFKRFGLQTPEIGEKVDLKLAKIHFWNQKFDKCAAILEPFLKANLFSANRPELEEKIMKYVSYFRIASWFSNPQIFEPIQQALERKAIFTRHPVFLQYTVLLKIIANFINKPEAPAENAKILRYLDLIVRNKGAIPLEKGSEILEFVSVIFSKYSKEHINILHLLKGNLDDSQANVEAVCSFLNNALFLVLMSLKTHPDFNNRAKYDLHKVCNSDGVREEIRQTVQNNWDITEEVEGQYISLKVNELKEKIAADLLEKNARLKDRDLKIKTENKVQGEIPDNARDILRRSHFNRSECGCSDAELQKFSPTKLIEQFLRQLKNMMFLDVTEDVLTYYNRFEAIIKEKNWNWHKFSYIPLLFNLFKQSTLDGGLDRMKLLRLLDEVFKNLALCIHDLKMIVLLLESFKQVEYLEVFVMYLHKMQPKLASLMFNWVFLENFTTKFDNIIAELYRRLYAFQFHAFENFPLMHFLNFESVLEIEKDLSFRIYRRYRYDVMADERFREIFLQYIDSQTLELFYFRFATYKAIVTLYKQPSASQAEVLRLYQSQMFNHTQNLIIDSENYRYFVYEFFVLCNFCNLRSHSNAAAYIVEIANHLKRKISRPHSYHFAVLASCLGNYFFKFKMFRESVKMKTLALETLKNIDGEPADFPEYVHQTDLKTVLFGILSFLYLDFIELEDAEQSGIFIGKLMTYDYENDILNLEKNLLYALSLLLADELQKAIGVMFKCKQDFSAMGLKSKFGEMFQAAIDKLDLMISERIDPRDIVDEKRRKSRQSISKLIQPA